MSRVYVSPDGARRGRASSVLGSRLLPPSSGGHSVRVRQLLCFERECPLTPSTSCRGEREGESDSKSDRAEGVTARVGGHWRVSEGTLSPKRVAVEGGLSSVESSLSSMEGSLSRVP